MPVLSPIFHLMDDNPSALQPVHPRRMSAEAMIGTGVTIWAFGLLFLMLGWAQHLREAEEGRAILLAVGAVLFIGGGIIWMMGAGRAKRR
ncbi:MAG TPA: hypothetical protein VG095_04200 [Chthoniobacterales bacterium]|nr:hypothetical protein [Chthoniobacterales bacterium]